MRDTAVYVNRKSREELRTLGNGDFNLNDQVNQLLRQLELDNDLKLKEAIEQHKRQGSATYFGDVFGYE